MGNRIVIGTLAGVCLCGLLGGCGGGSGSAGALGAVTIAIHWPGAEAGRVASAQVPEDAQSATVTLRNEAGAVGTPKTVDRPSVAGSTTEVRFEALPQGTYTASVTAYSGTNGTGTAVATGSLPVSTTAGQTTHESLQIAGEVATVEVSPTSAPLTLPDDPTVGLVATAKDGDGNAVLVAPGGLVWTSSPAGIVSVDENGLVTALAVGTTEVTVTETGSGAFAVADITVTGPGPHTTVVAALAQSQPGADPTVRLAIGTDPTALAATHGWLVFRDADNPHFSVTAPHLIDLIPGQRLSMYSDEPFQNRTIEGQQVDFQMIQDGTPVDAGVTASYNDPPLVAGTRYYYAVQRVIDPAGGVDVKVRSRQALPVDATIVPAPDSSVLSYPSVAAGPVTFFIPAVLIAPAGGASLSGGDPVTFAWQSTTGANEYIVRVFSNADGSGDPVAQSAIVGDSSVDVDLSAIAPGSYWWAVGARQGADPEAPITLQTGARGWLYSTMRALTIAATPG